MLCCICALLFKILGHYPHLVMDHPLEDSFLIVLVDMLKGHYFLPFTTSSYTHRFFFNVHAI